MPDTLVSAQSKFQIILEPFLWKKSDSAKVCVVDANESVGGFFHCDFGKEVVDFLADPFLGGTSAGDPESLVMRHSFPELWYLEKRFGLVIAGATKSKLSAEKEKSTEAKGSSEKKRLQCGSFSGTLFLYMMFPDRAPKDLYLYTNFIGGSRNKELPKASIDELKQIVTSILRQLLGVEGEPTTILVLPLLFWEEEQITIFRYLWFICLYQSLDSFWQGHSIS